MEQKEGATAAMDMSADSDEDGGAPKHEDEGEQKDSLDASSLMSGTSAAFGKAAFKLGGGGGGGRGPSGRRPFATAKPVRKAAFGGPSATATVLNSGDEDAASSGDGQGRQSTKHTPPLRFGKGTGTTKWQQQQQQQKHRQQRRRTTGKVKVQIPEMVEHRAHWEAAQGQLNLDQSFRSPQDVMSFVQNALHSSCVDSATASVGFPVLYRLLTGQETVRVLSTGQTGRGFRMPTTSASDPANASSREESRILGVLLLQFAKDRFTKSPLGCILNHLAQNPQLARVAPRLSLPGRRGGGSVLIFGSRRAGAMNQGAGGYGGGMFGGGGGGFGAGGFGAAGFGAVNTGMPGATDSADRSLLDKVSEGVCK